MYKGWMLTICSCHWVVHQLTSDGTQELVRNCHLQVHARCSPRARDSVPRFQENLALSSWGFCMDSASVMDVLLQQQQHPLRPVLDT